jgi:hypothetical protein
MLQLSQPLADCHLWIRLRGVQVLIKQSSAVWPTVLGLRIATSERLQLAFALREARPALGSDARSGQQSKTKQRSEERTFTSWMQT